MMVRIGLVSFAILASLLFGWSLLQHHAKSAHAAAGITRASTTTNPWGLALDKTGNIWVAEPGCDASPVCAAPPPGSIGEYATATNTKIADFKAPATYNPVFLAVDANGNVWFTDSTHNAIGELVPGTGKWTEYPVGATSTVPYDLVISGGTIWFTEFLTSKIGSFNIATHTFVENAIPTITANPYGITVAANGDIWFAENNATNAAKIGSFTPTATGVLAAGAIKEFAVTGKAPHLITSDKLGNIWFTEGFSGQVGEYTVGGKAVSYPVALGVCAAPPAPCNVHISGIAVDSKNLVWFDDSLSNRVGYINPADGTYTAISMVNPPTDTSPHTHDGLIVDASDNVWVSEQNGFNLDKLPPGSVTGAPYNTPAGPVAKTWYFAEGRVGKGFREYLTIDNPSTTACSVDINYYYTSDGSTVQQTKTASNVIIGAASRWTESVNKDIGLTETSPIGDSLASVVTMNSGSTCAGVTVERPIYFTNYHQISSGTDVTGATTLGKSFFFADVASDATHISYLTILNPPGGVSATVTATYYAGGKVVGTQNTTVPAGGRGTIAPGAITLPAHTLAIVTSTAPVMVERPTYFLNESKGVSGAYDIVGAPATANDWFFAEGYTGATTQEFLTIANPGTTSATANVILKSQVGGVNKSFAVTVAAQSQVIWNVNQNNTFGGTPEVSAEVQSTSALVVQREMFFNYHHSVAGMPTVAANGGTDVLGLVGPISKSSYSFAEGYTNAGYNEWLTLQNPNATAETVVVTLTNSDGRVAAVLVNVPANGRQTEDITADSVKFFNPGRSTTANAISMTVQTLNNGGTFVAERPQYYNTSGVSSFVVQGGTDIIGFGG
jgi:streptogramin lyase